MKYKLVNQNYRSEYVKNLLEERGVADFSHFIHPSFTDINNPQIFSSSNLAAKIMLSNLDKNILIIVDSDCDGYTSGAIMYNYLKQLKPDIKLDYILHERKQHGLIDLIDKILESKTQYDLIIQPDSGTNDYLYQAQMPETQFLILDHHDLDESTELIENVTIVNSQLEPYPNKELTGAGVTWQFCRLLDQYTDNNYSKMLIDLAALGIIGDMASVLEQENRAIIKFGLDNINNPFFKALVEKRKFSIKDNYTPTTMAFYVVPLINGMIRAGEQEDKDLMFQAFIDGERLVVSHKRGANGELVELATEAARVCTNAKSRQDRILTKITEEIEAKIFKYDLLENQILFIKLDEEDFPAELNGLVATRLAAKYKRPTMIGRLNDEGFDRGSIRGINDSELKDFKQYLLDTGFFEYVQGHANAAGYSLPDKYLKDLHEKANEDLSQIDFGDKYYEVNFQRMAMDSDIGAIISDIDKYSTLFGQHNPEPLICITNININKKDIQIMGKNADTVKIMKNGIAYMKFKANDFIEDLQGYDTISLNVVGRANMNYWGGQITPQIFIDGYEVNNGALAF